MLISHYLLTVINVTCAIVIFYLFYSDQYNSAIEERRIWEKLESKQFQMIATLNLSR